MKKNFQSLLTAAIFAAAVSTSAGGVITPQFASAEGADDITTVPQTTYGPPGWWMTEPDDTTTEPLMPEGTVPIITTTTTTTTFDEPELAGVLPVYTTTDEEIVQLMGEPLLYDEPGDLNMDGSLDARDVTLLKQFLLLQADGIGYSSSQIDLNRDGAVNKSDVKALIRMLTGKPEEEDEPDVTTTSETRQTVTLPTTTEDVTRETFAVLYGPPPAW